MSHTGNAPVFKRWLNAVRGGAAGPVTDCTDGPVWSLVNIPSGGLGGTFLPYCMTYGNSRFVLTQSGSIGGQIYVYTSTDAGLTWTRTTVNGLSTNGIFDPTYGNGVFICGLNAIETIRSANGGVSWAVETMPSLGAYLRVSFINGKFYLIQSAGILRSTDDGLTYSAATYTGISTMNSNAATDGSKIVIAGHDTVSVGFTIISTDDGLTWAPSAVVPPWDQTTCPQKLLYVSSLGLWVAIGSASVSSDNAYWSADGENWNTVVMASTAPGVNRWRDMVFADGQLLAVNSASVDVCRSTDGKVWTLSSNPMLAGFALALAANGNHVYTAQRGGASGLTTARRGVC